MEVYIADFYIITAVLSVLDIRTIKTSSKRNHITSPRVKLAAIIRGLISSTLNPCSKKADSDLVVRRYTNSGKQASGVEGIL